MTDEKKELKVEHKEVPLENLQRPETMESAEVKEQKPDQQIGQLREEIESVEIEDHLRQSAQASAQSIQSLQKDEQVQQLLSMAKAKGVVYAVKVAQKMNDPYVLDMLHDMLAKNGLYKEFLK